MSSISETPLFQPIKTRHLKILSAFEQACLLIIEICVVFSIASEDPSQSRSSANEPSAHAHFKSPDAGRVDFAVLGLAGKLPLSLPCCIAALPECPTAEGLSVALPPRHRRKFIDPQSSMGQGH